MNYYESTFIAKVEKAVAERWGELAAENPQKFWNEELAEKYEREVGELEQKITEAEHSDAKKELSDEVLVSERMLEKEGRDKCRACGVYSFKSRDDIYLARYEVCQECYFQYIHNREERWENGWRPECYE